jgi:hypothetical protein
VGLVASFAGGKAIRRDVRLASGAVVRRTNEARLVAVKLPQLGAGGSADVELDFASGPLATQPLLSAKEAPPVAPGARIASFRLELSGLPAIAAPKLDAITLTQRPDGTAATGAIAFEVGAGGAPPLAAWQKASGGHAPPRTLRIEYVGSGGEAILEVQLERCTPQAVQPLGANGTTRVTLSCATVRAH